MYNSILVPVDNSDYSNQAIDVAIDLGKIYKSKITGNHVYAAKMHDYRFKQMEFTLPEEYLQEDELQKQRKIHDSLITMGLKLITDCYLNDMDGKCQSAGISIEKKMMDGKHHVELLKDIHASDYDLIVMGALGIGKMKDSQIGAVTSALTRHVDKDVWVVKHIPKENEAARDNILVGIDGSPQSFGSLMTATDLAQKHGKKITLIGVYDPYLHYQVFNGIVDVLTDRAAKVFRFEEQNQLHEEIIDTGLAQIYQSHLEVAETMIKDSGLEVEKVLLDGKTFQKIADYIEKNPPWLLVVGRIGVHSEENCKDLGSNTENLLRICQCDILLSTKKVHPELDLKAEESIQWTAEAEKRMTNVPAQVKGIARTAILRLAVEQGHSVVDNSLIDEAMDRFMPKQSSQRTEKLAELLAFNKAKETNVAMCKHCGVTASEANPVKCSVCGGIEFDMITSEIVEAIIKSEGGAQEVSSYDGKKLKWTSEARNVLRAIPDAYQKRRAKAYMEKAARHKKMNTITQDFAESVVEELGHGDKLRKIKREDAQNENPQSLTEAEIASNLHLVARDKKGVLLKSVFEWKTDAIERILRVPGGFMRDGVQTKVEKIALDKKLMEIDLGLVEEGIELGKKMMEEMILSQTEKEHAAEPKSKPIYSDIDKVDYNMDKPPKEPMNEVSIMSELDKKRNQ